MKQKIVIKVLMVCDKCRSKAMKIAAATCGVASVALEGADRDQVVVIGNEVDVSCLTSCLRKKVGHACIVSVEEVKPPEPKKEEKKCPCPPPKCSCPPPKCSCCPPPPPPPPPKCSCPPPMCACPPRSYQPQLMFCEREPDNPTCTIM